MRILLAFGVQKFEKPCPKAHFLVPDRRLAKLKPMKVNDFIIASALAGAGFKPLPSHHVTIQLCP